MEPVWQTVARRHHVSRSPIRAVAATTIGGVVAALSCGGCSPPAASVAPTPTIAVNTPAGLRAQQTLDMLNSDWPIEAHGVRSLTAPDEVTGIQSTMVTLWGDRPYTLSGVDYQAGRVDLHLISAVGARQDVSIHTDDGGMVDRLDAELAEPQIDSWADLDAELQRSHAAYSYQVASVTNGRCDRIAGTNTGESLPLASIFKLYVLYAVGEAVKAGTLAWEDQLTVTRKAKAVDFANLADFPVGARVSVRLAAEKMIATSSNMATDLLLDRIGTAAVERALVSAGHHDAQSMIPFPTMHELFAIGWGVPDRRQEWKDAVGAGSASVRAQLLDEADSAPFQPDPQRNQLPASPYGVEWYGSAEDVCRVHVALQAAAVGPAAPIREILSAVPGVDLDSRQWPYVGAKGGNLPGDLTFSWYAVDRGGHAWVVSVQLNWPRAQGPGAGAWFVLIAKQVFAMLSRQS